MGKVKLVVEKVASSMVVDTMTIKDLGRWESLEMVQRYTRSVSFHDSLQDYTIDTEANYRLQDRE